MGLRGAAFAFALGVGAALAAGFAFALGVGLGVGTGFAFALAAPACDNEAVPVIMVECYSMCVRQRLAFISAGTR